MYLIKFEFDDKKELELQVTTPSDDRLSSSLSSLRSISLLSAKTVRATRLRCTATTTKRTFAMSATSIFIKPTKYHIKISTDSSKSQRRKRASDNVHPIQRLGLNYTALSVTRLFACTAKFNSKDPTAKASLPDIL